jgi:hypothetical protein
MRRESEGGGTAEAGQAQAGPGSGGEGEGDGDVLTQMIQTLLRDADTPPTEVEGVSEEFCDGMHASFQPILSRPGC